jgi:hypothetical protein
MTKNEMYSKLEMAQELLADVSILQVKMDW